MAAVVKVAVFATKGTGSNDEDRIKALLAPLGPNVLPFDRAEKLASSKNVLMSLRQSRPQLLVMEGTGLAGGLACLLGRTIFGIPYVVSSGDAVGPFVAAHARGFGWAFGCYERLLCRLSAGFIGWTPYLVGRALTFGAPRGVTAAGWAPEQKSPDELAEASKRVRQRLGIAADALVFGIVGSLTWNGRVGYCYGHELVCAMSAVKRPDAVALIVGGGSGLERLRDVAGPMLGSRVILTGPVGPADALEHMAAMDVGSLPQSIDGVGNFRYTTKVSEYLAAGLPVVTGRIPMAYDLGENWAWRLPGRVPWGNQYVTALANLIDTLTPTDLAKRREAASAAAGQFDQNAQVRRVTNFLRDLVSEADLGPAPDDADTLKH